MGRHARHRRTAAAGRTGTDRTDRTEHASSGEEHASRDDRSRRPARTTRTARSAYLRTGLLGVSAAVATVAVAVASGALPGGDSYTVGSGGGPDEVRPVETPPDAGTDGGAAGSASPAPERSAAGRDGTGKDAPSASRSTGPRAPHGQDAGTAGGGGGAAQSGGAGAPTREATPEKVPSGSTTSGSDVGTQDTSGATAEQAAARRVLALVNQERGAAGCSALRTDGDLTGLANAFSRQMAEEDFFDHTDPEGRSPWDRAAKRGISDLGGENIARGQTTATAVMDAWMKSEGHRANILNCDYKTIGIGVHMGEGGPWWTQDFGF